MNKAKHVCVLVLTMVCQTVPGYQFILSGYPAANKSYSAASSGVALVAGTQSGASAASPLEARYRTWDESDGIALSSDKFVTMVIYIR